MHKDQLIDLQHFMARASKATYASGGGQVEAQRKGFKELEYSEGDWYYRDSYTGSLRSWGQEVVYYKEKPVWICSYGGGMQPDVMDSTYANQTFGFLKQALLAGNKEQNFQPRGPQDFSDGEWAYRCEIQGDIATFTGHEYISQNDKIVFTHDFVGGLVIGSGGA